MMPSATISPGPGGAAAGDASPRRFAGGFSGASRRGAPAGSTAILPWLPLLILPVWAAIGSAGMTPWLQMLWVSFSLLAGLKWLSWRAAVGRGSACGPAERLPDSLRRRAATPKTQVLWRKQQRVVCRATGSSKQFFDRPLGRSLGYLLAWPGMDARTFLDTRRRAQMPGRGQWLLASGKLLLGVVLVWGLARQAMPVSGILAGWIGIAGFLAMFHFGLFDLLSLAWRTLGVEARPIMERPFAARTLSEFWGRRWNLAFRQVAFDCVYRPLIRPLGARGALVMVFVFSAVLHELAISLPAHGGYGLPSVYFLLQALGVVAARSAWGRRIGIDRGLGGRAFAWLMVVGFAPLLFHEPFATRVIGSLLTAVGAI